MRDELCYRTEVNLVLDGAIPVDDADISPDWEALDTAIDKYVGGKLNRRELLESFIREIRVADTERSLCLAAKRSEELKEKAELRKKLLTDLLDNII